MKRTGKRIWTIIRSWQRATPDVAYVTYFAFFSIFPALLGILAITQLLSVWDDDVRSKTLERFSTLFPGSSQLLSVSSSRSSQVSTAIIATVISIWAARNGMNALGNILRKHRKNEKTLNGAETLGRSLAAVAVLGGLLVLSALLTVGSSAWWAELVYYGIGVVSIVLGVLVIYWLLVPGEKLSSFLRGAAIAGLLLAVMLFGGGALLNDYIKHSRSTYGSIALVLGLMLWISLQVRIVLLGDWLTRRDQKLKPIKRR